MGFEQFPPNVQTYLSVGLFWGLSNGTINNALYAVAALFQLPTPEATVVRQQHPAAIERYPQTHPQVDSLLGRE